MEHVTIIVEHTVPNYCIMLHMTDTLSLDLLRLK